MVRRAARAAVAMIAGTLIIPGCVIRLGQGGSEESQETAGGGAPGGQSSGNGGTAGEGGTADDPFAGLDPVAVNREGLRASAAAYLLQGNVQQAVELQGLDPETIDEATMAQFVEDIWPASLEQADAWLATIDPSAIELVTPNPAYCASLGCPSKIYCDSPYYQKTIACSLQACGDASCKACPDWFGPLKNLVITGWCSYVCTEGGMVVGSAAYVITRLVDFQRCILP
jgi:hypothetical protein